MTRNVLSVGSRMWATVVAAAVAFGTAIVLAQTPGTDTHHDGAAEPAKANAGGMMGGQSAMADRKQMMAEQQAMLAGMAADDRRLTDLLAKMNAAKGEAKVTAMAAVVTELAAQRSRMQQQMMKMQGGMMDQMMAHMSAMHGGGGMMNKTAPAAPPAAADADHPAHHPEK